MAKELAFELGMENVDRLVKMRRYAEVISLCSNLLDEFPERFEPNFRRAHAWLATGRAELAIDDLTAAIGKNSSEPALFFFRGRWRIELRLVPEGIQDLSESISLERELNSDYYLTSSRLSRAVGYYLIEDLVSASAELSDLPEDATTFLAGRLWKSGDLLKKISARS